MTPSVRPSVPRSSLFQTCVSCSRPEVEQSYFGALVLELHSCLMTAFSCSSARVWICRKPQRHAGPETRCPDTAETFPLRVLQNPSEHELLMFSKSHPDRNSEFRSESLTETETGFLEHAGPETCQRSERPHTGSKTNTSDPPPPSASLPGYLRPDSSSRIQTMQRRQEDPSSRSVLTWTRSGDNRDM
ncbi:Hypothetical predicted protein [Xyrichtys novacula]|uniref:Uncharacterized protein n=1 Tax=Xyrichtys novacula TaxID=13765 RepID=A0AAV1FEP1_XYRNO|nr:Hypothetical predicted protein [Xyrichtys novacula]